MRIANNLPALNTHNVLKKNKSQGSKSTEKLSSGFRINQAADDAAGLAISERMRAQIRGLQQAQRNIQDGISLVHTAEGGFQEITQIIQRQRELIIQGMNDTYSDEDRKKIDDELHQLTEEINQIALRTNFNTMNLLARDDYDILADRSSHTVDVTTSGPFPPTTTFFETGTYFFPTGTTEVQLSVQTSDTGTTINDAYTHEARVTPITAPDGRQGYNDYEKNEHIHTETTSTNEYLYERVLMSDPRYKELDLKHSSIHNVYFQTELIPTGTLAGEYPDFGGFDDWSTVIEIDGVSYTLHQFTLVDSLVTADQITATYEKDGIRIEKNIVTNGTSFQTQFTVFNDSGSDDRQISFRTLFKPQYDGAYDLSSSTGVPVDGTAGHADIPDSGTVFEVSNDLVDYHFSFLSGDGYSKPDSLAANGARLQTGNGITSTWDITDFDNGSTIQFGFVLSDFYFKKDVYRVTNQYTNQIDSIVQTITTDMKDIDYVTPQIDIQAGDQAGQIVSIPLFDAKAAGLGITNMGIRPPAIPEQSLAQADRALTKVTNYRSVYGALQNRLENTMNNVSLYAENLTATESQVRDADIAKEMMNFTKANILTQVAQSMLAQANKNPQVILQLLQ